MFFRTARLCAQTSLIALITASTTGSALAQSAETGNTIALDTVDVTTQPLGAGLNLLVPSPTASRLDLTPLETPASVQIIPGDLARERGQYSVIDAVTQDAAGFSTNAAPGNGGTSLSTRGFSGHGSVMQLYDGTRLYVGAGTVTFPFDTWSAERIEVLRGPASVLYGDGAIGGVVNVVPRKPDPFKSHGEAFLALDSLMTGRFGIDATGPINDRVSYRLDIAGKTSEGWVDRGDNSNLAVSAAVRVQATDNLVLSLSNDYGLQNPQQYFGTPLINGQISRLNKTQNYNVLNAVDRYEDNWTQFKAEWTPTDQLTVRSTFYYLTSNRHWRNAEAYAFQPATGLVARSDYLEILHDQTQAGNRTDATYESQIFGMANQLVVGFDVNRINFTHTNNSPYGGTSTVPLVGFDPGYFLSPVATVPKYHSDTTQYSIFAEDRLVLNEQWSIVGGLRSENPTITRTNLVTGVQEFEKSYSALTGRIGVVFTPITDLAFYASYTSGIDPVSGLITLASANTKFDLTTAEQYEAGVKQSFWGGRGEWTLAVYDITKYDLLARSSASSTVTEQIGQQSSRGIEGTFSLAFHENWRLTANGAVLDAKYDNFITTGGINATGNTPVGVPEQVANVWLTWMFAPSWKTWAGLQYVGATWANEANTYRRPEYYVVNAGIEWSPTKASTVALKVFNLFDETYAVTGSSTNTQWVLGQPLTAELSASVRF
ncbi:TonB-dependent receptor [Azorhizobium oxalatiphilum]|uniref:TonB-dependent receptor n=1 Tax=Azorhizobium oxalatiphilum TaxID=980631 RepID=A0A917BS19_9HYPH|nr:TonB-dependent receptor [Azorhizobium oxalatiphilum]GGF55346.1 TonB-dependent receptor [Azorhizobium oxalatiphilum]